MKRKLTPRQHKILWATVRSYVATAEPVGSKALAENYDLGVSTATIRNDLALLEQNGFLFQPHTSAGRIPSDVGYRAYVDTILGSSVPSMSDPLADRERQAILQGISNQLGKQLGDNLDNFLHRAAQILASLSGCIAMVSVPQAQTVAIRHIQLVTMDPLRVMVIVVTDSYQTHSVLVHLDGSTSAPPAPNSQPDPAHDDDLRITARISAEQLEEELHLLSNFLNLKLRGKTFAELQDLSWLDLDRELRSHAAWLRELITLIAQKHLKPSVGHLFTSGVTELMRQPEFTQTYQVETVLHLLENNGSDLNDLLSQNDSGQMIIYIGQENPIEPIRHCTLITSTYYRGKNPLGSVSLLGPTRLAYDQAIASVEAVVDHLSKTLA